MNKLFDFRRKTWAWECLPVSYTMWILMWVFLCAFAYGCKRETPESDPRLARFKRTDGNYVYIWGGMMNPQEACFYERTTTQILVPGDAEIAAFEAAPPLNKKPISLLDLRKTLNEAFLKRNKKYADVQKQCDEVMTPEGEPRQTLTLKTPFGTIPTLEGLSKSMICQMAGGAEAYRRSGDQLRASQRIGFMLIPGRLVFGLGYWPLEAKGRSQAAPGEVGEEDYKLLSEAIKAAEGLWITKALVKDCPGPVFFRERAF